MPKRREAAFFFFLNWDELGSCNFVLTTESRGTEKQGWRSIYVFSFIFSSTK
jgi:hypothetical protein